jgi:hypothetical protein
VARVLVRRNGILIPRHAITISPERADRYFVRIAKGLLTHFYPDFDYSVQAFRVDHLLMPLPDDQMGMLFAKWVYDERGEGVFRFFRGLVADPPMGFWVLFFYDRTCFMVTHQNPSSAGPSLTTL